MVNFVTYSHYQIALANPTTTFGVIFAVLLGLIGITVRKTENRFFDVRTTTSLRGAAVLFLLFGHLSIHCLEQKMWFNFGGYWAVIIFLFISGHGLYQRYQLSSTSLGFWTKRLSKLYIPLWITLALFIALDYSLIDLSHSPAEIALNFMGFHQTDLFVRVNAAAWFVGYAMALYAIFWTASRMPYSEHVKVFVVCLFCFFVFMLIRLTSIKNYSSIWLQYTIVFPVGILFGKYKDTLQALLPKKIANQLLLLIPAFLSVLLFHKWNDLFAAAGFGLVRPLALIIPIVLLAPLYETMGFQSGFLLLLGNYSYEIYLLHVPFMVKYDFFLFRKPLYISFFAYFVILLIAAYLLAKASTVVNRGIFLSLGRRRGKSSELFKQGKGTISDDCLTPPES